VWDSNVTDVSLLEVFAEGDEAAGMEHQMTGFFEWSLLPPPIGTHVIMLGYPQANITSKDGLMKLDLSLVLGEGEVTDIYERGRDRGMFNFPCFRINTTIEHGFSGGPVFWDNRLCGIVSGGGFDDGTYAASRWPLCLLEYEYPDLGVIGSKRAFSSLFESGRLRSRDWPQVRDRITKQYDEHGAPYAHIAPVEPV
jgi:hypothetical protein